MKKPVRTGGGGWKLPTEEEVEVAEILLSLPKLFKKEELIKRYSFTWGRTNKRSVPEPSSAAVETDASAVGECSKAPPSSSELKVFKRKAKDELMEVCNKMHEAMESQHEQNLKLKAKEVQETSCSRNMEGSDHMWNYSLMKTVDEQQQQQQQKQQMTMFAPPTQQHDLCLPQLVDPDNDNDKLVGVSSFGLSNHRVTYDFMGLSQPLDQSECLVMDDDLRARNAAAAAARKRRMLKLKENKNFILVAKKLSRNCR